MQQGQPSAAHSWHMNAYQTHTHTHTHTAFHSALAALRLLSSVLPTGAEHQRAVGAAVGRWSTTVTGARAPLLGGGAGFEVGGRGDWAAGDGERN